MDSKSDNMEIMINDEADEVINELGIDDYGRNHLIMLIYYIINAIK